MEGFLRHYKFRYLKAASALALTSIILYWFHEPQQEPNGGTWLGYVLGTIGALLILWLMYFGRRKRNYHSNLGTVKGWLSAHVYFGLALLIIATLHTGFQLGYNIHTLVYVLMCLAILSGFYGAWLYVYMPIKKRGNLGGKSLDEHFNDIEDLDKLIRNVAEGLPENLFNVISSSIERTELGGKIFDLISTKDKSKVYLDGKLQPNPNQQTCIGHLVNELSKLREPEKLAKIKQLIDLFGKRKNLLAKVRKDVKIDTILKFWLFSHIPISVALLAALIVHIVTVFLYW